MRAEVHVDAKCKDSKDSLCWIYCIKISFVRNDIPEAEERRENDIDAKKVKEDRKDAN